MFAKLRQQAERTCAVVISITSTTGSYIGHIIVRHILHHNSVHWWDDCQIAFLPHPRVQRASQLLVPTQPSKSHDDSKLDHCNFHPVSKISIHHHLYYFLTLINVISKTCESPQLMLKFLSLTSQFPPILYLSRFHYSPIHKCFLTWSVISLIMSMPRLLLGNALDSQRIP